MIYRIFRRNKTTFFINLIGLSTGLASVMLIYLWVRNELQVNAYDKNDARLYQVMENSQTSTGITTQPATPDLLADAVVSEIPEVEYATAVTPSSWFGTFALSSGEMHIKAVGQFAGKDFFRVFSYDLEQGVRATIVAGDNSIAISEPLARKLFGSTDNAVGKPLTWQLLGFKQVAVVSGVFKGVPENSTERFDFVLSFDQWLALCKMLHRGIGWYNHGPETYLLLREGTDARSCKEKIAGLLKEKDPNSNVTLVMRRFSDAYLFNNYANGVPSGGRIEYVKLFAVIALFILLIACINFMNLSTAKATKKMREVGIRKAIGAPRKSIVFQHLGESVLMALAASVVALFLVELVLPEFSVITGKRLTLEASGSELLIFFGIALTTGLVAGSYPAYYLSGFRPAAVLKGSLKGSAGELWTRKGLVVFQFALSIILLVGIMVVYRQMRYIQSRNLGYNKDNVLYFTPEGRIAEHMDDVLSAIRAIPGVINASNMSQNLIGLNSSTYAVDWEGKDPRANIVFVDARVGYGLLETLGISMKAGRTFSMEFGSDSSAIIFNQAAVNAIGLRNPIGKVVTVWGQRRQIIGVTEDFNFESLHEPVKPFLFVPRAENSLVIMVRLKAGMEAETIARLQKFYDSYNPGFTFDYKFLDQDFQKLYTSEQRVAVLSRYFAGMAIIISCLGLFGLAAFSAERRVKEVGIRKVLGASVAEIAALLTKDLAAWVLVANAIAWPVAYYCMQAWLAGYAYRTSLGFGVFALAGGTAFVIALVTVGFHALKAATANPVEALRYE